jgi:hypothetical protein
MASLTLRMLYSQYPLKRGLGGPRDSSGRGGTKSKMAININNGIRSLGP